MPDPRNPYAPHTINRQMHDQRYDQRKEDEKRKYPGPTLNVPLVFAGRAPVPKTVTSRGSGELDPIVRFIIGGLLVILGIGGLAALSAWLLGFQDPEAAFEVTTGFLFRLTGTLFFFCFVQAVLLFQSICSVVSFVVQPIIMGASWLFAQSTPIVLGGSLFVAVGLCVGTLAIGNGWRRLSRRAKVACVAIVAAIIGVTWLPAHIERSAAFWHSLRSQYDWLL